MNNDEMQYIVKNQNIWRNQYYLNKRNENIIYKKQMAKEQIERKLKKKNNEFKQNICGFL